jgi:hypothetical protein
MKFSGLEKRETLLRSVAPGRTTIFDGSSGVEDSDLGFIIHNAQLIPESNGF